MEKEWPALRSEIGVRAWRHKGQELLGTGQSGSDPAAAPVALDFDSGAGVSPASSTDVSPVVPDAPSRFHVPLRTLHSEVRTLDIQGDDINLFASLPLFELA